MATTPLIVGGLFKVGATDFSDAVTRAVLQVTADEVEVPATLGTPKSARKGGNKYELVLDYLSNDTSASAELWHVLWTAITTDDGQLDFTLQVRDGDPSATNPQWTGTFVALSAQLGGAAESLSQGSGTFPLIGIPTKNTGA